MRETPLTELAKVHRKITKAPKLFDTLNSFAEAKWAFRGQGQDWPLAAKIERCSIKPGIAAEYAMREFQRRIHRYTSELPGQNDDLECLALMQHHGAPTRLLDWTRSPQVAAYFAAQSCNSAHPFVKPTSSTPPPFVIWAVDTDRINAEARIMLGLSEDTDLSSPDRFHKIFWSQPPEESFLVMAVEPYRTNERLTVQKGLFLFANHPLFPFHNCLAKLLIHAKDNGRPSDQWLHKIVVSAEVRGEVLRTLDGLNINDTTLFPGLDGFCRSLEVTVQLQERNCWPGGPAGADRESWVKGTATTPPSSVPQPED